MRTRPFVRKITSFRGRWLDDKGFSLVEELVSLAVVSMGLILLVAMISTGSKGVASSVDHVTAEGLARSQIEQIKADAYGGSYSPVSAPAGYSIDTTISYWDPNTSSFIASDTGSGLQRITVAISRGSNTILQVEDYKVNR